MRMKCGQIVFGVLLLVAQCSFAESPLGSGFTYQGELQQNGNPVDGTVYLRFSLWDRLAAGNRIGATQAISDVPVVNGLFSVVLNASGEFGGDAFNGGARWLEVEVCEGPNCDSPIALSPRQPVTAAPYSLQTRGIFVNEEGDVGIGTTTPAKRLTVAGDAEIGTGHGDYRHTRIGGGNSSGFLYGSFPRFGDGIHLGYNYYADAGGTDRVIQSDGATSRLSAGYGALALATGGIGQPPIDRLVVDSVGNVRLGANTQLYAPGGEENLRIIRGVVAPDGAIIAGAGFSVTKLPFDGQYTITFSTSFDGPPSIVAMAHRTQNYGYSVMDSGVTSSEAGIIVYRVDYDGGHTFIDNAFHFIAIGPR